MRGFFIQIPEAALSSRAQGQSRQNHMATEESYSTNDNFTNCGSSQQSVESSQVPLGKTNYGLPSIFIKVQASRGLLSCTTEELVS